MGKSNKDISTGKNYKKIKECMDDLVECVNYKCEDKITLGLKPLDVKIMKMKAKNLLDTLYHMEWELLFLNGDKYVGEFRL